MVIQVKGLVAALESHQTVGLEGWWSDLIDRLNKPPVIDDYAGNKRPFSREYTNLIKQTFGNTRWVKELQLTGKPVNASGIASRLINVGGPDDYWEKALLAIKNAEWLAGYADIVEKHSKAVNAIHEQLVEQWDDFTVPSEPDPDVNLSELLYDKERMAALDSAIEKLKALDKPLDWAFKHSKPCSNGRLVKDDSKNRYVLATVKSIAPKELPCLTDAQLAFAIEFINQVSQDDHRLDHIHYGLHQSLWYPVVSTHEKIWDELYQLDSAKYSTYLNLVESESVTDKIFKLAPGFGEQSQIAAGLVLWVVRSTGSTGASLESVSLEGWWDTLVDAITGVENVDDYRGKKTPWSDEYKKLMRGTFANSRWVSKQKVIEGTVSGGGVSKRFGCISNSIDYWANIQLAIENAKWIDGYLPVLKKYSDNIRAIHDKLSKDCKDGINPALVRAAIKEIKALEHPTAYIVKNAKPCLHGKIVPDGKSYKIVPQNNKFETKIPALTQSQFEEAVKIIVAIHNETHPLCKQRDAFWDAAQFCDADDFISELMDEDESLGMQYSDLTYWQSLIDDVTPPGDEYEIIQAGLVIWAARSVGSTAASLESFNESNGVTVELIARTAHEAVRSLAQSFGDQSHLSWESSPKWVRESAINGAALHILNPGLSAEATHEAWLKARQEEGWSCGPTKDADRKEHPCMVPYAELSREHRLKDHLFKATVDAFMACLREDNPDVQVVGLECACGSLEQQYEGSLVNKVLNSSVPV